MLPANVTSALQLLSRSGKPLIGATADTPNPVTRLEPGQQLQASVQSKVSEGIFKVQVAGQTLQMRLPGNIQSGDTIKLEVIATQPRIAFSMAASTNPLSTPEQIGATARILSNLAELPLERPIVQQLGNKAVWNAGEQAPDTMLLAGALRDALGKSGLFYESHQAQWVRGERSTNQLLEEPQNMLTGKSLLLSPTGQQAASTTPLVLSAAEGSGQASPGKVFMAQSQSDTPLMAKSAGDTALPIAKELLPLVQQQLHTLEHHHLVWMGQVWPGQQMQWEIQGEPEQQTQQQSERQWSTEMELALPGLGDVHARLVFAESGLRLTLHAADPATVDLFNRNLPRLKNSLADADIPLVATVVEKS
ncbi:MAG: flagellar hook-length control protein FliK [Nitrosomonadales bacterium]|nr:flagellar hook-length control protein FliK [Nitrosomonadales bacterium]